jgi:hypothetical protein
MTANQFLAALKAEGVRLTEVAGWKTHNRDDETGKPFGPVFGIVNHHTGGNYTPTSVLRNGTSALPGPLCMGHLPRDGMLYLVGYGRCNHAGMGDKDVLAAMKADVKAPLPNSDDVDFNDCTYSLEVNGTNDGKPFTPEQIDTMVRFNTAICRFHGWKRWSCVGHRSITKRKPYDPSGITVDRLQDLVELRLKYPANTPSVAGVAKPPPAIPNRGSIVLSHFAAGSTQHYWRMGDVMEEMTATRRAALRRKGVTVTSELVPATDPRAKLVRIDYP